jgi:SAM-dependent methyltransferase
MHEWRSYDDVAPSWHRVNSPRYALVARDLLDLAGIAGGARVLDVGTGTGALAGVAADTVREDPPAIGVDVSTAMLDTARRADGRPRFVAAAATDLPFRDGTFDIVAANFVLHHFVRPENEVFDMIRVLRPGGRIALSTWGSGEDDLDKTWRAAVEEVVGPDLLRDAVQRATPGRTRFGARSAIEEFLLDAGLRHVRTEAREYRFSFSVDDYVTSRSIQSTGRFVREMVGDARFHEFLDRARTAFADRFADPLNDFRDAWLAVGTRA